jgi:hypothetical protein
VSLVTLIRALRILASSLVESLANRLVPRGESVKPFEPVF